MLGIITGITGIAYNILIHKIPPYMIVVGGVGLLVLFLIGFYEVKLWNKMQELNKEMQDVE
jgi:type VI protein secretion system component VasF